MDSATLLDPYIVDLDGILSDPASQFRQGAIFILAITKPTISAKASAVLASHLEDKSNSNEETLGIAGALLQAYQDTVTVHRILMLADKRSETAFTDGVVHELGLVRTHNPEALAFIGKSLDSKDAPVREAAVDAAGRIDRETRARFTEQLARIGADPNETEQLRAAADAALRNQ